MLRRVQQLHEQNPMLGLRVCRLGIVYPEIYAMQVRAIFEAACDLRRRGVDARPDVMIPGVGTKEEMQTTREAAKRVADEIIKKEKVDVPYRIGTMIELPRACIVAGELAADAEFFSFGTNDLTQTTYGTAATMRRPRSFRSISISEFSKRIRSKCSIVTASAR